VVSCPRILARERQGEEGEALVQKILVVDDLETTRQQVALLLSHSRYEVLQACHGREALGLLRRQKVSLMLCDVNMPEMNGMELLECVRRELRPQVLPILMLTAEGRADLLERARRAGAQGWIIKPFQATLLLAAVDKLSGRGRRERDAGARRTALG
jgi:two-component system chemotaxis response regulator CheY